MASINFPLFLQRYTPKIAHVLIFTFLEWTLIALLFLNYILFFLITKFASLFGLQTPCILCSSFASKFSLRVLICKDHMNRISRFKRGERKRNRKDTGDFNYIIYGPPWRVVECAKNGNVVDKIIKRESAKDCCVVVKEGDHRSDFVEDDFLETMMHNRCIIDEEKLVPVELIDQVTMQDGHIWFHEEMLKRRKREFTRKGSFEFFQDINTAGDGKTKLKNEARDSIYVENYSPGKDRVDKSIHKTSNQCRNTHSYSSLSDVIPIEITPPANLFTRSEPTSPKFNELENQKTKHKSLSCKSLHSSFVKRNKENTDRGILHSRDQNISSYKSIFEITPIQTASFVNIASEPISDKHDELDASVVKGNEEEIKGEMLIKLDKLSLEKFEEERCSVIGKLNQKEEQASENVTEEEKPNLQQDYKSLSDFLNREMNYSTNDLVSLGKGQIQRKDTNLKMKRVLPSLQGFNLKKGVDNSRKVHKLDAGQD